MLHQRNKFFITTKFQITKRLEKPSTFVTSNRGSETGAQWLLSRYFRFIERIKRVICWRYDVLYCEKIHKPEVTGKLVR